MNLMGRILITVISAWIWNRLIFEMVKILISHFVHIIKCSISVKVDHGPRHKSCCFGSEHFDMERFWITLCLHVICFYTYSDLSTFRVWNNEGYHLLSICHTYSLSVLVCLIAVKRAVIYKSVFVAKTLTNN